MFKTSKIQYEHYPVFRFEKKENCQTAAALASEMQPAITRAPFSSKAAVIFSTHFESSVSSTMLCLCFSSQR